MGVQNLTNVLREHAPSSFNHVAAAELAGKHIAIDASVSMYQFLATTQQDMALMVRGLFLRTVNLIANGIKPIYVFDGKAPEIKNETLARREKRRVKAADQIAASAHDEEESVRLAKQTMRVTPEHVKACKELFDLMGVPYVQAPEEAEAQCVELVKSGRCYAVGSEDSDVLPFGGAILLKKLTFCSGNTHATAIDLQEVRKGLNMGQSELIDLCILLGCDFCDTIKNIGQVSAVKLLKQYRSIEVVITKINQVRSPLPPDYMERVRAAREYFKNPPVRSGNDLRLQASFPQRDALIRHLVDLLKMPRQQAEERVLSLVNSCGITDQERSRDVVSGLQTVAARFLKSIDTFIHSYSRYYTADLKAAYTKFSRPITSIRYTYGQVIQYLRQMKYVYFERGIVVIKPIFVDVNRNLVFTVNPGSEESGVFFVCLLCARGLSTTHGLATHQQSDTHKAQERKSAHLFADGQDMFIKVSKTLTAEERGEPPSADPVSGAPAAVDVLYCEVCSIRTTSEYNMMEHKLGRRHKINEFRGSYRKTRGELIQNKRSITIEISYDHEGEDVTSDSVVSVIGNLGVSKMFKFKVKNIGKKPIVMESCLHFVLYDKRSIVLSDSEQVTSGRKHTLPPGGSYWVHMTVKPHYYGRLRVPVLFKFNLDGAKFKIMREVIYKTVSNAKIFQELEPVVPYTKPQKREIHSTSILRSDNLPDIDKNYSLEKSLKLGQYNIPSAVSSSLRDLKSAGESAQDKLQEIITELNLRELDFSNYAVYFNNLLYLEESQMKVDIGHYTMESTPMRRDARNGLIRLMVPGLAENRPSVLRGDRLYACRTSSGSGVKYEGHVHNVTLNEVFLGFHKKMTDNFIDKMTFRIEFTINRLTIKLEHRAVSWAGEDTAHSLEPVLFPTDRPLPPLRDIKTLNLRLYNRSIQDNKEQNTAVRHIVAGTSRPAPYLIYGPPGTGKTFTLVEAIKQVYREFPNCRILACAPQNAAADLLTRRLLEHVLPKDIYRVNALSRPYNDIEAEVQRVSNYRSKTGVSTPGKHALSGAGVRSGSNRSDMEIEFPCRDLLKQKKIVVSTLVTSGRLVSAEMGKHFTHIFIDEAGHATEPETVIPLAGLLDVNMKNGGQLVLAGDPKQLGPIIRSGIASSRGLGKSLLERLMSTKLYKRDPEAYAFNENYVTKLVRSFRSHPDILEVPNVCFYENELETWADQMDRERFCQWEDLPTKGFPLIFHGVNGDEEREGNSPSWFNRYEVMQVVSYVQKLMECKKPNVKPAHIGIISPYHQQVNKIRRALSALEAETRGRTRNYADIKVGSVEKFQGDEREVIIISTVRSQDAYLTHDKDFNLGFIGNPKRFNVAVTRAKSLLIVIGNPGILRRDKNWTRLLAHIEEGGGCVGSPPPDEIDEEEVDDLTENMANMNLEEVTQGEVSEELQQGDQEWRRGDQ